ncbi:MAG: outer membrane beta-barrel protein [Bacteroidetes bacterium]|nr:outer membrane beta-barrel protein [Bacteroidota bacterium]
MLNLSDKELDRLSREAAQEHDPGDVLGPRSWDKLEPRLDTDLGKTGSSPLRAVRRFPFYYAPAAILLVAGVIFFTLQNHRSGQNKPSGSPPTATSPATQSISLPQNSEHSTNSTLSANSSTTADSTAAAPIAASPNIASPNAASPNTASPNTASSNKPSSAPAGTTAVAPAATGSTRNTTTSPGSTASATSPARPNPSNFTPSGQSTIVGSTTVSNKTSGSGTRNHQPRRNRGNITPTVGTDQTTAGINNTTGAAGNPATPAPTNNGSRPATTTTAPRALTHANLPGPNRLGQRTAISDSALRAYTAKTSTIQIGKSKSLRINRTLQFGLSLAPDFSSVNSLAGDKPGSTIGLTLDYQFANHWYLSTGLLLDRKNYAARAQDYHVPDDYYRINGIHNVDFVKGSLSMLEIPLNLRYDFSVTGNTLFFASAGVSSYLMTNENCNYYFNAYGPRTDSRSFNYSNNSNYLFSTINLSLGVETGISDDLSLLVSPYIKLPSQNIGFGQISMSSVGVTFALKFSPVISKRRK